MVFFARNTRRWSNVRLPFLAKGIIEAATILLYRTKEWSFLKAGA